MTPRLDVEKGGGDGDEMVSEAAPRYTLAVFIYHWG